ncbi:hypothetical protein GF352_01625 [archaeon]|nr:hypothetical protein [archaeon]
MTPKCPYHVNKKCYQSIPKMTGCEGRLVVKGDNYHCSADNSLICSLNDLGELIKKADRQLFWEKRREKKFNDYRIKFSRKG